MKSIILTFFSSVKRIFFPFCWESIHSVRSFGISKCVIQFSFICALSLKWNNLYAILR